MARHGLSSVSIQRLSPASEIISDNALANCCDIRSIMFVSVTFCRNGLMQGIFHCSRCGSMYNTRSGFIWLSLNERICNETSPCGSSKIMVYCSLRCDWYWREYRSTFMSSLLPEPVFHVTKAFFFSDCMR